MTTRNVYVKKTFEAYTSLKKMICKVKRKILNMINSIVQKTHIECNLMYF